MKIHSRVSKLQQAKGGTFFETQCRQGFHSTGIIGVGTGGGVGRIGPPLAKLEDNPQLSGSSYVHKLFDIVARKLSKALKRGL